MISKGTFVTALSLIHEQSEIDERFSDALNLVGNGHFAFGTENKYLEALLLVLKDGVNDQYDYIGWWLYETTSDYRVGTEDGKQEWDLKEPEALYDFILNECR